MIALSSNLASFVSFWRFSPRGLIPSPFGCAPRSGKAFESVDYSRGLIRFWRAPNYNAWTDGFSEIASLDQSGCAASE